MKTAAEIALEQVTQKIQLDVKNASNRMVEQLESLQKELAYALEKAKKGECVDGASFVRTAASMAETAARHRGYVEIARNLAWDQAMASGKATL